MVERYKIALILSHKWCWKATSNSIAVGCRLKAELGGIGVGMALLFPAMDKLIVQFFTFGFGVKTDKAECCIFIIKIGEATAVEETKWAQRLLGLFVKYFDVNFTA